jgi:hypothetical protein
VSFNLNREPEEETGQEEETDKENEESPFMKKSEEISGPFVLHS